MRLGHQVELHFHMNYELWLLICDVLCKLFGIGIDFIFVDFIDV